MVQENKILIPMTSEVSVHKFVSLPKHSNGERYYDELIAA